MRSKTIIKTIVVLCLLLCHQVFPDAVNAQQKQKPEAFKSEEQIRWERMVPGNQLKKKAFRFIKDDPRLPRALLIGDSISIGYTEYVRKLLSGKVNVHRIPDNGSSTVAGIRNLNRWLDNKKWGVIHFNWGLHDLQYSRGKQPGTLRQRVPLSQYKKNLRILVTRLKSAGAKLVFATTTPFTEGVVPFRIPSDVVKYNFAALEIMSAYGIEINDLYSFSLPRLKEIQRQRDVHFLPQGYQALAGEVAASILNALNNEEQASKPNNQSLFR